MWKALYMQVDIDNETVDTHGPLPAIELPEHFFSCRRVRQLPIPLPRVAGDSARVQLREQGLPTEAEDMYVALPSSLSLCSSNACMPFA